MRYAKMHGAGNSFILLDALRGELQGEDLGVLALQLCRPADGAGVDGMIVLTPAQDADFAMRFYNADGSLGEMCGNGARCAARYGVEHGLVRDASDVRIRATAGLVRARRLTDTLYELRLNDPSVVDLLRPAEGCDCAYVELGEPGIPHAVTEVPLSAFDDLDALRALGRALRHSEVFPRGANVSFVSVTGPDSVRAITYERGVEDFTLACGTGCGALALSLLLSGRLAGDRVKIEMPGGRLSVTLRRESDGRCGLYLTGPTAVMEEGER